jgi:hypothetical protein
LPFPYEPQLPSIRTAIRRPEHDLGVKSICPGVVGWTCKTNDEVIEIQLILDSVSAVTLGHPTPFDEEVVRGEGEQEILHGFGLFCEPFDDGCCVVGRRTSVERFLL